MELKKAKGKNSYTWMGLTLGKLLAIKDELGSTIGRDRIGSVAYDVLRFLENQELDKQEPFD